MCPARLSAQGPAAASRWSDEEHDILVDLTNEQLELEKKDETKVIPWARHWINVSERLHKKGYSRTSAACLGYWKRTVGAQKANEKAAGPRWDDAEHQILLGMTEEQLELEETDPSAVMSWAKHWKRVSERLKENGYTRSVDACDAYWNLVQDKSPLAAGTGLDVEDESLSSEEPFEVNCGVEAKENEQDEHEDEPMNSIGTQEPSPPEDHPDPPVDPESPTISEPKRTPRRVVEKEAEPPSNADIETTSPTQSNRTPRGRPRKNSRIEKESTSPNQPNRTPKKPDGESASPDLVQKIKAMIEEIGYTPEVNDLPKDPKGYGITKWQYLRWHREQEQQEEEQPEEQQKSPEPEKPQEQQKQPEQQEKIEIRVSPQPTAQWSSVNSPCPVPVLSKSPSIEETKTTSFKNEGSQQTQFPPEEKVDVSPVPSGKKPRSTAFRFTPEQRAYLEEKVARTGSNPDVYSRIEMANELRVEEKTIRNWFINHRQKTNRRSLEDRPRDDFKYANEYSLASMAVKRTQGSIDGNEIIEVVPRGQTDSPGYGHQHKKPRLDGVLTPNLADQSPIVSPPMSEPINIIRKIAPRGPDEAQAPPAPPPPSPHRGPEIPPPSQSKPHIWVQDGPPPPRPGPLNQQHRIIHESPYGVPPHARHTMHPEPPQPPHPHSAQRPPPPPHILESQSFQPVNKPPPLTDYEPVTPSSWNAKPSASGSAQSQYSNETKPSSMTPQPAENDKDWAARRVPEIQAQISVINRDSEARMVLVSKLEQEIEVVKNEANAMQLRKDQEIAQALREIERRYEREYEMLRGRQSELGGKREEETELLRRNTRQVAKCERKMISYQALVDLDNDSEVST